MQNIKQNTKQHNKQNLLNKPNHFSFLMLLVLFSFSISFATAQNSSTTDNQTEEADWSVATTEHTPQNKTNLTEEEKQVALGWEEWDKQNPSQSTTVIFDNETKETNKIKSPEQVLRETLIGSWEGFYGGSKAYITFKENKTVIINTSVFSNIPTTSGRDHTQLYYEIDATKSPYQLIFYNRDREIKGVFRVQDNKQIVICHNFKDNVQPTQIDNKYTTFTLYKIEKKETKNEEVE